MKDKLITLDNSLLDYRLENKEFIDIRKSIYLFLKRVIDILFVLVGGIPLLIITVIIKIVTISTGDFNSIFLTQNRIGKDGREFKFYKFRSMIPNADEALFKLLNENSDLAEEYRINKKLKNDPRITKIGKFIRKTSIDELPQLLNILKGDMTLIGNRPYLPREKESMENYYQDIIKSKPGITGIWQTNGRSNTTFETRCKMEAEYSKNMSLGLDIKIFFKTFIVIFKGL